MTSLVTAKNQCGPVHIGSVRSFWESEKGKTGYGYGLWPLGSKDGTGLDFQTLTVTIPDRNWWRPKTTVRLMVHQNFENEKTIQDWLRLVLTSLASLQGKVLYFIDFQLNFQWHLCPSQWQTMFLMGPIANPPPFGNHSQTVFPANCHPPTCVSTLPSLKLRYGGGSSQLHCGHNCICRRQKYIRNTQVNNQFLAVKKTIRN